MSVTFSIIMPSRRKHEFFHAALRSVLDQSCRDFELIIVDDSHEQDLTVETDDHRIRLLRCGENRGVSAARNLGITESRGTWLAFHDDDDRWPPNKLERYKETIEKHHADFYCSDAFIIDREGRVDPARLQSARYSDKYALSSAGFEDIVYDNFIITSSVVVRRGVCIDAGMFDPHLSQSEDLALWTRIALSTEMVIIPEPLCYYRQYGATVARTEQFLVMNLRRTELVRDLCTKRQYRKAISFVRFRAMLSYIRLHRYLAALKQSFISVLTYPPILADVLRTATNTIRRRFGSTIMARIGKEITDTFRPGLKVLYLFVTSACNGRCGFCFYKSELNQRRDMTLEELEKVSKSVGRISTLMVSGGEPFLRKDLAAVIKLFYHNSSVQALSIPTNGSLTDRIIPTVWEMVSDCPGLFVNVQISLDDLEQEHDRIRGIPGGFKKALETVRRLKKLKEETNNLSVSVSSVVGSFNAKRIGDLLKYVKELDVDYHNIELERPSSNGSTPDEKTVVPMYRRLVREVSDHYDSAARPNRRLGRLAQAVNGAVASLQGDIKARVINEGRGWPVSCLGGRRSVVIDHDGRLRPCEMRRKSVNLRDFRMNVLDALRSVPMRSELSQIHKDECWKHCTHGCYIHLSLRYSPKGMFLRIPARITKNALRSCTKVGS